MNPIEEIKTKLRKYPHAKYETDGSSITVLPTSDTGFTVGLEVTHGGYTVSFNGWHEEFDDAAEALDCFAFGLSDECRLKEYRRGKFAHRWTVESKQNGQWIANSETGLFILPFWKRSEIVYCKTISLLGLTSLVPKRHSTNHWTRAAGASFSTWLVRRRLPLIRAASTQPFGISSSSVK